MSMLLIDLRVSQWFTFGLTLVFFLDLSNGFQIGGSIGRSHQSLYSYNNANGGAGAGAGAADGSPMHKYLATCIPGLSGILADELEDLGAINIETSGNAAVKFEGNTRLGLNCLIRLRTAHRLMQYLASTSTSTSTSSSTSSSQYPPVQTRDDLYNFIRESVNVKKLLGDGKGGLLTLRVSVVLNHKQRIPDDINHSHYTALTIKNALCDAVRDLRGDRPNVGEDDADVPLVAVFRGMMEHEGNGANANAAAEVSLYRCLHPQGSLHRRGYRGDSPIHVASMKESMAAGLLLRAGWNRKCEAARKGNTDHNNVDSNQQLVLVDPMAGSGSLILEAAMIAANVSPGLMRIKCGMNGHRVPPVLRWKNVDGGDGGVENDWKDLLIAATHDAKDGINWLRTSGKLKIIANDIHGGALGICANSLEKAGFLDVVQLIEGDCNNLEVDEKSFVVTNPPWGVRLTEDMEESWEALRIFIRSCVPGTEAWVLSGNKAATKHLGLKKSDSMGLQTADQQLRWIQYCIFDKSGASYEDSDSYANVNVDDTNQRRPRRQNNDRDYGHDYSHGHDYKTSKYRDDMIENRSGQTASRRRPRRGSGVRSQAQQEKEKKSGIVAPLSDEERQEVRNSWLI